MYAMCNNPRAFSMFASICVCVGVGVGVGGWMGVGVGGWMGVCTRMSAFGCVCTYMCI